MESRPANADLDFNIQAALPSGCRVLSTKPHGVSFFAQTRRIDVELSDAEEDEDRCVGCEGGDGAASPTGARLSSSRQHRRRRRSFFVKIVSEQTGGSADMVRGEYESMRAIHARVPDFCPRPVAWGTLRGDADGSGGAEGRTACPRRFFFLCEFRDMKTATDDDAGQGTSVLAMPGPEAFAAGLAALHTGPASSTTPARFGFHVATYAGNLPQEVAWCDSWETFFSRSLRKALQLEIAAKGPLDDRHRLAPGDGEFERVLVPALFERVIPRLLGPLEVDGRRLTPALVHGDLWYANSGVDSGTGLPLVFDACCFYAHNEYEFGQWMPACNRFGEEYLEAYRKIVPISPPEEDYRGRLDLYKLRFNTHVSALFVHDQSLRDQVLNDIRDLVQRYGTD